MKLTFGLVLVLLLSISTHTLGVEIQAEPSFNSERVIEIELNKIVSLVCELDDKSEGGQELVWLRNGAAVHLQDKNRENRSSVCVNPIYEDNGATFTCHLKKNSTVSSSVTLNVTHPPQLSGTVDMVVEEDAELLLNCDIWANPRVSNVFWTQNGSAVDLEESGLTVSTDGSDSRLYAPKAQRGRHEGTYQCSVTYFSDVHTKVFNVTLTDKTFKFPLMPLIAAIVIVVLTAFLALLSRWRRIVKCFK